MIAHRPTYIVNKEMTTVLKRFTTNVNEYGTAYGNGIPGAENYVLSDTDTVDFWNFYSLDNPQAIALLRFHLVVTQPGDTQAWHAANTVFPHPNEDTATCGVSATCDQAPLLKDLKENVDKYCWNLTGLVTPSDSTPYGCGTETALGGYFQFETSFDGADDHGNWAEQADSSSNTVIYNMRTRSVTHRIPLEHCGDGKVDADSWFEQCEINSDFYSSCPLGGSVDSNGYCPG